MATFRREITPTGRRMFQIAADYYLDGEIHAWAKEVVHGAGRNKRPPNGRGLEDVLQELDDLASNTESDWEYSARRFREAGWLERLQAVLATIRQRGLPYKYR